ncbi:hypothetical protein MTO96_014113 [Rhipicephalus appendiculatus]
MARFTSGICPVPLSGKKCTFHTTNGDSLEYQISDVGRDPAYDVIASFSTSVEDMRCLDAESSVLVRSPSAAGGHNSGSSTEVCGLLTLALLLLPVLKSCLRTDSTLSSIHPHLPNRNSPRRVNLTSDLRTDFAI